MIPFIVLLMLLGAGAGYAASAYLRLGVDQKTAVLAGAIGGLIGGFGLRFLLGGVGSFIGAVLGAALIIAVAQAVTRR